MPTAQTSVRRSAPRSDHGRSPAGLLGAGPDQVGARSRPPAWWGGRRAPPTRPRPRCRGRAPWSRRSRRGSTGRRGSCRTAWPGPRCAFSPNESMRLARARSGRAKPPRRRATAQASISVASSMPPIHVATAEVTVMAPKQREHAIYGHVGDRGDEPREVRDVEPVVRLDQVHQVLLEDQHRDRGQHEHEQARCRLAAQVREHDHHAAEDERGRSPNTRASASDVPASVGLRSGSRAAKLALA